MLTTLRGSYINLFEWNSLRSFVNLYSRVIQYLKIPEELFYNEINHLKLFSGKYLRRLENVYGKCIIDIFNNRTVQFTVSFINKSFYTVVELAQ